MLFFCALKDVFILIGLHRLIFLPAKHFKSVEQSLQTWSANQMSSFSELKITKMLSKENGLADLKSYNSKFLSRVYPKGTERSESVVLFVILKKKKKKKDLVSIAAITCRLALGTQIAR